MWFYLALATALFTSFYDVIMKAMSKKVDIYLLIWSWVIFPLPFFIIFLCKTGWPDIYPGFFVALAGSTVILFFASIFYIKAISSSPLSVTMPMLTFTPLFLLFTSWLMLNERPRGIGLVGVLLIVVGSYVLNIKDRSEGYLAPWKNLIKQKGPKYMLIVAVLYSVGANLDKIGVVNSSPAAWIVSIHSSLSIIFTIVLMKKGRNVLDEMVRYWPYLVGIGLCTALALICQMSAIKLTIVPYLIAIKRTSVIFTSLLGFLFFKERHMKERLIGMSIMIIGVFCVVTSGL
ncbi:MAG: DMT family transporter [Candidatus Omnitrophica bacterium]|nr:DMT family transporter [Candidatus Omnitrophota bacterium]